MSMDFDHAAARRVQTKLGNMARRVRNPEQAWPRVGKYLSREIEVQFITEGAHFGRPWRPLTPAYKMRKRRMGYSRKILVATGDMKSSFTSRPMDVEIYEGNTARFGSNNQKAIWHQFGTRRNGKQVNPPRPMLVVTPEVRKGVKEILANYVGGR